MSTASAVSPLPATLTGFLGRRAEDTPNEVAYVYLRDGEVPGEQMTFRELRAAAAARGAALASAGCGGRNALLAYPACLEFIRGWLGCVTAGMPAAPVPVPKTRDDLRRLAVIAADAGTDLVLTTAAALDQIRARFGGAQELARLNLVATETLPGGRAVPPAASPGDVALLQYTSGSTGSPKGVMVTHANFVANAAETDALWPLGQDGTLVSWLPFFHDMGFLLGVVLPLWAGRPAYLMSPESFIRRPCRWLEAISRFRGTHSAAPSFAYELCTRDGAPHGPLDLSCWRAGVSGAEPVREHTLRDFIARYAPHGLDPRSIVPAYGLAEHTLKVSGTSRKSGITALRLDAAAFRRGLVVPAGEDDAPGAAHVSVVSCGITVGATRVRIVDPRSRRPAEPDAVGEIWVSGPCVTAGYIGRPGESERTFRARVAGDEDAGPYLRTGDLGFVRDGQVYVTGRLSDLMIIDGLSHYPQDIEHVTERSHPLLRPASSAAFTVDDGNRRRLVVLVEADGRVARQARPGEVETAVRAALRRSHGVVPSDVLLVRRGTLPRTTSGKVRRRACRELYQVGTLRPLEELRTGTRLEPSSR